MTMMHLLGHHESISLDQKFKWLRISDEAKNIFEVIAFVPSTSLLSKERWIAAVIGNLFMLSTAWVQFEGKSRNQQLATLNEIYYQFVVDFGSLMD